MVHCAAHRRVHVGKTRGPSSWREIVGAAEVRTPSVPRLSEQLRGTCVEILYVFHTKRNTAAPSSSCWPLKIGETLLVSYFLSHRHVLLTIAPTPHNHSFPSVLSLLLFVFVFNLVCSLSPQGREGTPSSSLSLTFSASPLNLGGKVTIPLS